MINIKDKELKKLYGTVDFIFKKITHVREHLDIIFVFGKYATDDSIRTTFMNFIAANNTTQFQFITIETLYEDLVKYASPKKGVYAKKIALANLELNAIENAYSILIFPESPGSFAELGYFSAIDSTREKIIVSNSINFYNEKSYVNSLIELVHSYDREASQIVLRNGDCSDDFNSYLDQLTMRYNNYENEIFINKNLKKHYMFSLAVIYESIKLFPFLEYSELKSIIRYIFDKLGILKDNYDVYLSSMISLLYISGLINRETIDGKIIFTIIDNNFTCFKFGKFTEKQHEKILAVEMTIRELKKIL